MPNNAKINGQRRRFTVAAKKPFVNQYKASDPYSHVARAGGEKVADTFPSEAASYSVPWTWASAYRHAPSELGVETIEFEYAWAYTRKKGRKRCY